MNSNNNIVNEYQYEYDSEGNWISQIIFENERPEYIIERQIEYYKRGEFKIK